MWSLSRIYNNHILYGEMYSIAKQPKPALVIAYFIVTESEQQTTVSVSHRNLFDLKKHLNDNWLFTNPNSF